LEERVGKESTKLRVRDSGLISKSVHAGEGESAHERAEFLNGFALSGEMLVVVARKR
jgi:hypothetical protein